MKKDKARECRRETVRAGENLYIKISSKPLPGPKGKREGRVNPTPEAMLRVNERNSLREFAIRLDANFTKGDMHAILTFRTAPSPEEAKRLFRNFIKRLSRAYRSRGLVFKWMCATEYKNSRIHCHVVLSAGLSLAELSKIWGHGIIRPSLLYGETFFGLAQYLTKETRKTFRDPDSPVKRRWSCSRNVAAPVTHVDFLTRFDPEADPVPPKGFYIREKAVYRGENPFTGGKYVEYVAIPLDGVKRSRLRGKKGKPRNDASISAYRKTTPRQQRMDY